MRQNSWWEKEGGSLKGSVKSGRGKKKWLDLGMGGKWCKKAKQFRGRRTGAGNKKERRGRLLRNCKKG